MLSTLFGKVMRFHFLFYLFIYLQIVLFFNTNNFDNNGELDCCFQSIIQYDSCVVFVVFFILEANNNSSHIHFPLPLLKSTLQYLQETQILLFMFYLFTSTSRQTGVILSAFLPPQMFSRQGWSQGNSNAHWLQKALEQNRF